MPPVLPAKLLTMSQGFQDSKGNPVANGMLMLTLSQTATVTATGGQVTTEPIFLNLDANGKITNTACWYSDEISPSGTIYYGVVYAANKVRMIPGLDKLQYSFTGAGPFDLATAVQSGPASPSYSGAVVLNPTGQQNINGQTLNLEGASLSASAAASTTADTFLSRLAAGVYGVGTAIGNALGTLRAAILQIGGSDLGITRTAAATAALGNGTQGDITGNLKLGTVTLYKSDGTLPATFTNDTAGGINFTSSSGRFIEFNVNGQIVLFGLTSGSTIIKPPDVASGTITFPSATGTLARTSGDTLTSTTLTSPTVNTPTISSPTMNGALTGGSMIATGSVATCSIGAGVGAACSNTITWNATLSSTSYKMLCEMDSPNTTSGVGNTGSKTTTTASVSTINFTAGTGVSSGTVRCVAIVG